MQTTLSFQFIFFSIVGAIVGCNFLWLWGKLLKKMKTLIHPEEKKMVSTAPLTNVFSPDPKTKPIQFTLPAQITYDGVIALLEEVRNAACEAFIRQCASSARQFQADEYCKIYSIIACLNRSIQDEALYEAPVRLDFLVGDELTYLRYMARRDQRIDQQVEKIKTLIKWLGQASAQRTTQAWKNIIQWYCHVYSLCCSH